MLVATVYITKVGVVCSKCGYYSQINEPCIKVELGRINTSFYAYEFYCLNCSKNIINQLKPIMNSDLWVFK